MKKVFKILAYIIGGFLLMIILLVAYVEWGMAPAQPKPENMAVLSLQREKVNDHFYKIGNNWLRKSKSGLWEEYIEGEPFERGVITGKLNKELLYSQEVAFTDQIHQLIPNDNYLRFLSIFTRLFNRDLPANVTAENKLEIYGESFSAPHDFDYISPAYDRMLNYHAAHDIGHALQNFALVGCTSFGAWDSRTPDSSLIIARNCDFFVGDKFAENKIMYFCHPKEGYNFAMVTWAGMMGCLSGMNVKGLTVTINAAKSDMPTGSATPIALLAREILQYAGTIDEAYAIAKKRKTFVSETIMIGSAADHRTGLIEKSPARMDLYRTDKDYILCTNHYQGDTFANDKNNLENIATSASMYRFERLQELIDRHPKLDYLSAAAILRDRGGLHDDDIGVGNEKSINQLICHHSVIFEPDKLLFWVSTDPYQLGAYMCYDLKKVFAEAPGMADHEIAEGDMTIPADTFLQSQAWQGFLTFRDYKKQIKTAVDKKTILANEANLDSSMIKSDRQYWETYYWLGDYYLSRGDKTKGVQYLNTALSKEVNDKSEVVQMEAMIKKAQAK